MSIITLPWSFSQLSTITVLVGILSPHLTSEVTSLFPIFFLRMMLCFLPMLQLQLLEIFTSLKSSIFICNFHKQLKEDITATLEIPEKTLPINYLGIPLF